MFTSVTAAAQRTLPLTVSVRLSAYLSAHPFAFNRGSIRKCGLFRQQIFMTANYQILSPLSSAVIGALVRSIKLEIALEAHMTIAD